MTSYPSLIIIELRCQIIQEEGWKVSDIIILFVTIGEGVCKQL